MVKWTGSPFSLKVCFGFLIDAAVASQPVASGGCLDASSCSTSAFHTMSETMQAALSNAATSATGSAVQLLQSRARQRTPKLTEAEKAQRTKAMKAAAPPALRKTLPVGWLHAPKAGTSFVNTLIHLPGVCPDVPEDLTVSKKTYPNASWCWTKAFREDYNVPETCPGLLDAQWGHQGLKSHRHYKELLGKYMMMVRQPEQRLIAAYHDLLGSVRREDSDEILNEARSWGGLESKTIPTLAEWGASARGCVVKMLTRTGYQCGPVPGPPTWEEVDEAKRMLHDDFSFLGLTDDWALSICLFSAMFDVPCHASQMEDTRSSRKDNSIWYSVEELGGITDPYDGVVYNETLKIFNARLKKHNVTEAWCRETCWRDAGIV
mmetsp:Transcript_29714/g.85045  ORF Transcript_29714/g.85045 Transcript_29714/m.85045 type:complete len:377 (-) Transcript_29714:7-1137(-)